MPNSSAYFAVFGMVACTSPVEQIPTTLSDTQVFLNRLPGLWVGPVDSETSVGDFPTMNMDIRPADGYTLFSRTDLDAENSLRFAFGKEQQGEDQLVFRNGGYFLGVLRDTRMVLTEVDDNADRWRFCALEGGCEMVDAVFDFSAMDEMNLHVEVMGETHFDWPAIRKESREVEPPFPVDEQAQPGNQPFPELPQLLVHLSWSTPLTASTTAWVLLSTTDCFPAADCQLSRFLRIQAPVGATSVDVQFEQIHPGEYKVNTILDYNNNLEGGLFPGTGDIISLPDQVVVISAGNMNEKYIQLGIVI